MAGLAAIVMALGVLIGPGADRAMAYPEPSVIPTSWELDVTYKRPRLIRLVDFAGEQSWYWFMVYEVTNNTGEDRLFVPDVAIADDAGRILNAGQQVPSAVYPAIKRRLGDPLLVSPVEVVGTLRQGEDNARRTVAIWPALPDVDVDQMSVFLSGLSGETVEIQNPLTAEPVLLRKTLMLDYTLPGAPLDFGDTQIRLRDATWIMR